MYKILDNLATHGIEYNYDNNQYLISKDSVSEEEILTFSEATDEDANKWLIIDARIISDYKVNDMQDYLALIDTCSLALSQNHRILVWKIAIGEYAQYEHFVEKTKQDNRSLHLYMNIVPVNFSTKHRAMLGNVRKWIDKGHVAIDSDLFPELLTELRIATSDEEMSLDKSEYSMDLLDSLRLSMEYIVY